MFSDFLKGILRKLNFPDEWTASRREGEIKKYLFHIFRYYQYQYCFKRIVPPWLPPPFSSAALYKPFKLAAPWLLEHLSWRSLPNLLPPVHNMFSGILMSYVHRQIRKYIRGSVLLFLICSLQIIICSLESVVHTCYSCSIAPFSQAIWGKWSLWSIR